MDTCVLPVCVCKLHRTNIGMFLLLHGPFFCLSLSLSFCFSFFFRLTISIFIYFYLFLSLSLSFLHYLSFRKREVFSLCFAKRRSVVKRRGIVINTHRFQRSMFISRFLIPPFSLSFFLPVFEKEFRLLEHTPVPRCL